MEILKACKRCNQKPHISHLVMYGDPNRATYSVSCCGIVSDKTYDGAIYKWNMHNVSSKDAYQYNRHTNEWDLINAGTSS